MAVIGPFEHTLFYYGLSTDTKPGDDKCVRPGSRFIETDTSDEFVYTGGGTWTEIKHDVITN
jgi:hypothetical protein